MVGNLGVTRGHNHTITQRSFNLYFRCRMLTLESTARSDTALLREMVTDPTGSRSTRTAERSSPQPASWARPEPPSNWWWRQQTRMGRVCRQPRLCWWVVSCDQTESGSLSATVLLTFTAQWSNNKVVTAGGSRVSSLFRHIQSQCHFIWGSHSLWLPWYQSLYMILSFSLPVVSMTRIQKSDRIGK